jgi:Mg-chelatase subunit ChlD
MSARERNASVRRARWILALLPVVLFGAWVARGLGPRASATPAPVPADIPAACAGDNPYFAAARPASDPATAPGADPALVAFADTPDDDVTAHLALATHAQIGATYGLAYDWRRGHVYAAAFHKRGASIGPAGPGGIYRIILALGTVEPWAALDAGTDRHGAAGDEGASRWVGRTGLADLELDDTASALFAVNLFDRRIYRLSVPDGAVLGSFAHGAAGEPWADTARPFALGFHEGWLYHGVVDTRERTDVPGALQAVVYRSRPDGSAMTRVLTLDLSYRRQPAWVAWTDVVADVASGAQPLLADIVFRPNGDPIIGLRDRTADMAARPGAGDVLPTRANGTGWDAVTDPEHYRDRWQRDESLWGALATMPGFDLIVASASAPMRPDSAGVAWLYNDTGTEITGETIAGGAPGDPVTSSGLGDLELLCGPRGAPTLVPTLTPTATPTPTPTPAPAFLPIGLRESCPPTVLDVALVLDLSTSMRQDTREGRPKVEAALDAAATFISLLDLSAPETADGDRAAIVAFNARAWSEQSLTRDAPALRAALGRLPAQTAGGTRLDLAVAEGARAALGDGHRERALPVVVLLTDGRPNLVPAADDGKVETTVLRAADAARAGGARVYTVGVGTAEDVDGDLLRGMASEPSGYLYTPDAEDLRAAYAGLAGTVRCPGGRHDWSRPWP